MVVSGVCSGCAMNKLHDGQGRRVVGLGEGNHLGNVTFVRDEHKFGRGACLLQSRVEGARLGRQSRIIPLAIGNEERRRRNLDVKQRRGLAPGNFVPAKYRGLIVTLGQIKNTAERYRPADGFRAQPVRLQVSFVEREQGREVSACGMAAQVDAIRIASVLADVPHGPGKRSGDIFNLRRVRILRRQPVARHDRQDAFLGEPISQGRILGTVAGSPGHV